MKKDIELGYKDIIVGLKDTDTGALKDITCDYDGL